MKLCLGFCSSCMHIYMVMDHVLEGADINNRIVGGELATPGQFKYIASLRLLYNNRHMCGATVIGRRTVLTAAHCKDFEVDETVIVVGTNLQDDDNAPRYMLKSFTIHEEYNPYAITNDVAVIILAEDIKFNDFVQPIALASRPITVGERLTSSGFGYTSYPGSGSNELRWMQMNVLSHEQCTEMTGTMQLEGKICTLESVGHAVCLGDSGGPLVNDLNEIVGITSAVHPCALGKPDYFTDVYYFKDWIIAHSEL